MIDKISESKRSLELITGQRVEWNPSGPGTWHLKSKRNTANLCRHIYVSYLRHTLSTSERLTEMGVLFGFPKREQSQFTSMMRNLILLCGDSFLKVVHQPSMRHPIC
jgi:hypothetical protein